MFKFEYIYILYVAIALIVPGFIVWIIYRRRKIHLLEKMGDIDIVNRLSPHISKSREVWKFILFFLAFLFIAVGIAGPKLGSKLVTVKRKGIELVIALDVSNSMLAEDIKPNRLTFAKRAIEQLVDRLQNDKLGLIVFAGDAYTQLPITTDYVSAKMFLQTISPKSVPVQGTNLTKALEHAMNSFTPDNDISKAIILITDGETHEEQALETAKAIAQKGIRIYTIGIGSPQGVPIPIYHGKRRDFRHDQNGNIILSKLNESILMQIAAASNGTYVRATQSNMGLRMIYEKLNSLQKKELKSHIYADYENYFQPFVAIGLFLLLIELLLSYRKSKWSDVFQLKKMKL
jgi:Ca-activated chloride channel family protein